MKLKSGDQRLWKCLSDIETPKQHRTVSDACVKRTNQHSTHRWSAPRHPVDGWAVWGTPGETWLGRSLTSWSAGPAGWGWNWASSLSVQAFVPARSTGSLHESKHTRWGNHNWNQIKRANTNPDTHLPPWIFWPLLQTCPFGPCRL